MFPRIGANQSPSCWDAGGASAELGMPAAYRPKGPRALALQNLDLDMHLDLVPSASAICCFLWGGAHLVIFQLHTTPHN